MTLEGCVVRFSDTIAYVGRDVQDAIEVGILGDTSLIPEDCREILGTTNDEIINTLILDVIENSQDDDKISYSCEVSDALEMLKKKLIIKISVNVKHSVLRKRRWMRCLM
jgi:dGTPase